MSLKTMNYVEPDNTPTEEQIAQSIPSGGGHNYTRLPEGVVPFEPATFFKQHQSEEKAICEMLVLPFGVDEQSLKMLPPAYTELDYLGKGHWQLDYFVTHAYANTDKGRRTFACPQSVGAQVEGTCPMCDKRVELLRAIKDKCGKWDPTQIPEEFGKQKAFGAFLAFVNNTDKVYYVEERTAFRYKNAKGKDATSDTKTTLFSILKDNQLLGNVTKRFWAMSSSPMWLRISWKYTKFPRNDGSTGFFWEVTGMKSVETSLTGIKAADVQWEHYGNPAYNPCRMVEFLDPADIRAIVDGIVPVKKKEKELVGDNPCWDDIANLEVPELIAYAKRHKMDMSAFEPSDPKPVIRKAIMDHFNITRPAA